MSWDSNLLIPVGHANLTLADLIGDSLVITQGDGSLALQYAYPFNIGNLSIDIPDTSIEKSASLQKIRLGTRSSGISVTLGQIAKNLGSSGELIISANGTRQVIPSLSDLSTGTYELDMRSLFDEVTFVQGQLEIRVDNGLPVDIEDLVFELSNSGESTYVIRDTIPLIRAGETHSEFYDLADKTLKGQLSIKAITMNSPGSRGQKVLIDTTDALSFTLTARNMLLSRGIAVFPAQNLVDEKVDVRYNLGDARITKIIIGDGDIVINATSTIPEVVNLTYDVPSAIKSGQPLLIDRQIPASVNDVPQTVIERIPLHGYETDLTGQNGDTYNTFYNRLIVAIDSTGRKIELDLKDSIVLEYGLVGIRPIYAEGYLGQDATASSGSLPIDVFSTLSEGTVEFSEVNVDLRIENYVGAPAEVVIGTLKANNSRTGNTVTLMSEALNGAISILPALDKLLTPRITTISLTPQNSNVSDLINLLPDRFEYTVSARLNPEGKVDMNQFIHTDTSVRVSLVITVPLKGKVNGLILRDTIDLDLGKEFSNVKDLTFNIQYDNSFPMTVGLETFAAESGTSNDTRSIGTITIPAGSKGIGMMEVDMAALEILKRTGKIIVACRLDTDGVEQVRNTDGIELHVGARAGYRFEGK